MAMRIPIYFWYPVLGCFGLGFIFMSLPPVSDRFMDLFGVGYGGLSVFLSAIYWTHSASQVPAGLIIDRIGAMRSLMLSLGLCLAASLVPFLAPDRLGLAIAMRLIMGLGTGMMFLVLVKILKILTPPNYVARAQGAQGAAFCLGTMAPYLVMPHAGSSGWVAVYLSGVVFCAVIGASALRLPMAPLRESRTTASVSQVWQALKAISTSPTIWFLGCCHGFFYGSLNTLGNWLPPILADTRKDSVIDDWAVAASVVLLAGTLGRVFSGDATRLMPREVLIRRAMVCVSMLYAALSLAHSPWQVILTALALAALCGGTYASVFTLTIDVSAPAYVATAVGFMNMVANGVNVLLILLLGNMREYTGNFGPGLAVIAGVALILWRAGRHTRLE